MPGKLQKGQLKMSKRGDVRIIAPLGMSSGAREVALKEVATWLYRSYFDQSQKERSWSPYRSFNLNELCQAHSSQITQIVRGFFAVEQFIPDYSSEITRLVRKNYGQEHFQQQWGAEEAKHSDLWRLALEYSGSYTNRELTDYADQLKSNEWGLPWEDPLHMLFYTVVQERATHMSYSNFRKYLGTCDPVLSEMTRIIAVDEVYHHNFFLRLAAAYLYFKPAEAAQALCDVLGNFSMPASDIIPDYQAFAALLEQGGIYTTRTVAELHVEVRRSLGIRRFKAFEEGVDKSRHVPDPDGCMRSGAFLNNSFNPAVVEKILVSLFSNVMKFQTDTGLTKDPFSQYLSTEPY